MSHDQCNRIRIENAYFSLFVTPLFCICDRREKGIRRTDGSQRERGAERKSPKVAHLQRRRDISVDMSMDM